MNHFEYIKNMWAALYDPNQDTNAVIEHFFHDDYTQCINGITMNRSEYIEHVHEQKKNLKSITFTYQEYLSSPEKIFIIYSAAGKNLQDEDLEAEIIAYFSFKNDKIFKIHGGVRLIQGTSSDVDMDNHP